MDLDGLCSLAIAMDMLNKRHTEYKAFGYHYGDPIDFAQFVDAQYFIFMDVFPSPYEEMYEKFKAICPYITVLDHHKTFIESSVSKLVNGMMTTEYAGCALTWKWFHNEPMPDFVALLERYDRWDNKNEDWETEILPFQAGAKALLRDPTKEWGRWQELFDGCGTWDIMLRGKVTLDHERARSEKVLSNNSFSATFNGLRVLACNDGTFSSQLFDSKWDESKYDAMLGFCIRANGKVSVSLYATADSIDCTPVVKLYGGGGHAHACGCMMTVEEFFRDLKIQEDIK
jgi:oligoribonuclease NrnB/cAMP/cGMP phosphodiesterase (DHH superfamily)